MENELLPPGHPVIAFSYTDIASVYSSQNDYNQALEYHLQALDIRKKGLPANHHYIAWSLHQIGRLYHKMNHLQLAFQFYFQSLEIYKQWQTDSFFISILCLLDDISSIYGNQFHLSLNLPSRQDWLYIQINQQFK
ncbi:unnamed protein product [Rotaria sp. Silwood1]|nr:unnamed protein product [Rotaria sp. Silwood1]CAF1658925.1 unnamed protein product [Rotaria sp. Silwood1]